MNRKKLYKVEICKLGGVFVEVVKTIEGESRDIILREAKKIIYPNKTKQPETYGRLYADGHFIGLI